MVVVFGSGSVVAAAEAAAAAAAAVAIGGRLSPPAACSIGFEIVQT